MTEEMTMLADSLAVTTIAVTYVDRAKRFFRFHGDKITAYGAFPGF
jgi:hypothetical protein